MHLDSNCVQVLAPLVEIAVPPANYIAGEQLCHVSRDVALVLSLLMDANHISLHELNEYGVGFIFKCVFSEDSNHREEGFRIEIIVHSLNSDSWTDDFTEILKTNKIKFSKYPTRTC